MDWKTFTLILTGCAVGAFLYFGPRQVELGFHWAYIEVQHYAFKLQRDYLDWQVKADKVYFARLKQQREADDAVAKLCKDAPTQLIIQSLSSSSSSSSSCSCPASNHHSDKHTISPPSPTWSSENDTATYFGSTGLTSEGNLPYSAPLLPPITQTVDSHPSTATLPIGTGISTSTSLETPFSPYFLILIMFVVFAGCLTVWLCFLHRQFVAIVEDLRAIQVKDTDLIQTVLSLHAEVSDLRTSSEGLQSLVEGMKSTVAETKSAVRDTWVTTKKANSMLDKVYIRVHPIDLETKHIFQRMDTRIAALKGQCIEQDQSMRTSIKTVSDVVKKLQGKIEAFGTGHPPDALPLSGFRPSSSVTNNVSMISVKESRHHDANTQTESGDDSKATLDSAKSTALRLLPTMLTPLNMKAEAATDSKLQEAPLPLASNVTTRSDAVATDEPSQFSSMSGGPKAFRPPVRFELHGDQMPSSSRSLLPVISTSSLASSVEISGEKEVPRATSAAEGASTQTNSPLQPMPVTVPLPSLTPAGNTSTFPAAVATTHETLPVPNPSRGSTPATSAAKTRAEEPTQTVDSPRPSLSLTQAASKRSPPPASSTKSSAATASHAVGTMDSMLAGEPSVTIPSRSGSSQTRTPEVPEHAQQSTPSWPNAAATTMGLPSTVQQGDAAQQQSSTDTAHGLMATSAFPGSLMSLDVPKSPTLVSSEPVGSSKQGLTKPAMASAVEPSPSLAREGGATRPAVFTRTIFSPSREGPRQSKSPSKKTTLRVELTPRKARGISSSNAPVPAPAIKGSQTHLSRWARASEEKDSATGAATPSHGEGESVAPAVAGPVADLSGQSLSRLSLSPPPLPTSAQAPLVSPFSAERANTSNTLFTTKTDVSSTSATGTLSTPSTHLALPISDLRTAVVSQLIKPEPSSLPKRVALSVQPAPPAQAGTAVLSTNDNSDDGGDNSDDDRMSVDSDSTVTNAQFSKTSVLPQRLTTAPLGEKPGDEPSETITPGRTPAQQAYEGQSAATMPSLRHPGVPSEIGQDQGQPHVITNTTGSTAGRPPVFSSGLPVTYHAQQPTFGQPILVPGAPSSVNPFFRPVLLSGDPHSVTPFNPDLVLPSPGLFASFNGDDSMNVDSGTTLIDGPPSPPFVYPQQPTPAPTIVPDVGGVTTPLRNMGTQSWAPAAPVAPAKWQAPGAVSFAAGRPPAEEEGEAPATPSVPLTAAMVLAAPVQPSGPTMEESVIASLQLIEAFRLNELSAAPSVTSTALAPTPLMSTIETTPATTPAPSTPASSVSETPSAPPTNEEEDEDEAGSTARSTAARRTTQNRGDEPNRREVLRRRGIM